MRRGKYVAAAVIVGVMAALALPGLASQQVTVTGEVIDSVCYIRMGAKGAGHRNCTQTCADNGVPLALLEEGTDQVIWLASKESRQSPNADLRAHASHIVKITGEYEERGGAKILVIDTIEHVSAGS